MKKQRIQIILLVVILFALVGILLGVRQYNRSQAQKTEEPQGEALSSLTSEEITWLSFDYEGTTYAYDQVDGTWYYTPDHERTLTQYRIQNAASSFAGLTASSTIENVEDLSQYGLDEPERSFSFGNADQSYTFQIGADNDIMDLCYICRPGENTVYAVDLSVISSLNWTVDDVTAEEEKTDDTAEADAAE